VEISEASDSKLIRKYQISDTVFATLLVAIALGGLIPRLVLGISYDIGYDNAWHIFIATQDRWELLLSEWRKVAHPPLYYLLLRYVARLGPANLIYRALSIIPGVATIYVIGKVADKLYERRSVALLAAGAYALSLSIIGLDIDVRAYPLALLFMVSGLYCFAGLVESCFGPGTARLAIAFGVLTSLAICSEYYAVFFLAACIGTLVALFFRLPEMRRPALNFCRRHPYAVGLAIGLPICMCVWLYSNHVQYQRRAENSVMQFYWSKGTSMLWFVSENLRSDLNYCSPIELSTAVAISLVCILLVAIVWRFVLLPATAGKSIVVFSILLILLLIISELIVLSLIRRYPFGGYARQQSILFPFFILTAFLLLDRVVGYLPAGWPRIGLSIAAVLAIAASFSSQWRKLPGGSQKIAAREYNAFRQKLPRQNVVYLDQFSLIPYYIHTRRWKWRFERHFREPDRLDEYETTSPSGEQVRVIRNTDRWNFDLLTPDFYVTLFRSLRDAHLDGANLFFLKQGPEVMDSATLRANERRIRELASNAGLRVEEVYYESRLACIAFKAK